MFFCGAIVLVCVIVKMARSRSIQLSRLLAGRITTLLGCAGVIGLLLSSVTLYLSYRPYAEIIRAYLRDGDSSRLRRLEMFFNYLDYSGFYALPTSLIYFWIGVIALCAVALIFTTVHFIAKHRQPVLAV